MPWACQASGIGLAGAGVARGQGQARPGVRVACSRMGDASDPTLPLRPALLELPLRAPRRALAALALVTVLLGLGLGKLEVDPSTEHVFPAHHPAVEDFARFRRTFGGDERLFLALRVRQGDVFTPDVLRRTRELARGLQEIPGVERAFGLADMPVLRLTPLGPFLAPGLPEDLDQLTPAQLEGFRREVLGLPYVERMLVSPGGRATTVVAMLAPTRPGPAGAQENLELVHAVEALVAQTASPDLEVLLAGSPLIKARITETIQADLITFTPPLLIVATLVTLALLRSLRGVALVLLVLVLTVVWVMGALGHLGITVNTMTSLAPCLVLVVGVADALHVLVEQGVQAARMGPEARGAASMREAVRHVAMPCFLTSLTTMVGFGSLFLSDIKPIREFGLAASLAAACAYVVTLVLLPACAALLPPPRRAPPRPVRLDRLARWAVARPRLTLAAGGALTTVLGLGVLRIQPDTDFLNFFPASHRLVREAYEIQELFAGIAPAELIVTGPPGCSRRPEVLRAVFALERALEEDPAVDLALSAADLVAVATELRTRRREVPADPAELAQVERLLQALVGGRLPMEDLISPPGEPHPGEEWLRVNLRVRAGGSAECARLLRRIDALRAEHLAPLGLGLLPTGTSVVFSQTADEIMRGQVESFLTALGVISLVMFVALRSLVLGVVSVIPNLVPIAAILGAMGYMGIHLSSFNAVVCSVAIGLAVDDTIHLLSGFQRFVRELPRPEAVRETIAHEGAAVVSTSLVLASGFSVLLLGSFLPTQQFGLLMGISIAAALLSDLFLLPALLLLLPERLCRRATTSS